MERLRIITRTVAIIASLMFLEYLLLMITAPFGVTKFYSNRTDILGISDLVPDKRVRIETADGEKLTHITDDLVYFTVEHLHEFDYARIAITYDNPWSDQDMYLGFRDRDDWHYTTKLIDAPILNAIPWKHIGSDPTLFMRTGNYDTLKAFLEKPPDLGVIGLYGYDASKLSGLNYQLNGYTPSAQESVMDIPLRGKHTLYVYAQDEPFRLTLEKQDLNWYEGADIMTVDIFKEGDLVYHGTIPDDGNVSANQKVLRPQVVTLENPGPDLPETGVYKVVIDASTDVIIKRITTNLSKFVIDGPVFPVSNSDVYPEITASTSATTLYTDSVFISAMTPHSTATQSVEIVGMTLAVDEPLRYYSTVSAAILSPVTMPLSDVVLNGIPGYFSPAMNHWFRPFRFNTYQISQPSDIDVVDYVLADYSIPDSDGRWRTAYAQFDLSAAVPKDGKLEWLIRSPKLGEKRRSITIKNIEVLLKKKPVIQTP